MVDSRNPSDFYILDLRTSSTDCGMKAKNLGRNFEWVDLEDNDDYKVMKDLERSGKLKEAMAQSGAPIHLRGKAENFHDVTMMPEPRYKAEEGFVWIPKTEREDAKKVMKALRVLDKEVEWFHLGQKLTEEELREPEKAKSTLAKPNLK
jgi:hypothetical protein